ncbi:MAG: universal stress protein [Casimicrobiaceae bacterium]
MFKHILIPTDGSELSEKAARGAVQMAKSLSAKVTAVTVSVPFHVITADVAMATDTAEKYRIDREAEATLTLAAVQALAKREKLEFNGVHLVHDDPYRAIIDTAGKSGCDLICMASHGRRGVSALLLGSETVKVLTHSKIPVLVWR